MTEADRLVAYNTTEEDRARAYAGEDMAGGHKVVEENMLVISERSIGTVVFRSTE